MDHRIGNLFALVNGLVNIGASEGGTAPDVTAAIRALHKAHALIRRGNTGSATSMIGLLQTLLRPYDDGGGRISVSGEDVRITASAVMPVALVFHELATNAVKYGALHDDAATLRIPLRRHADCLLIGWNEKFLSPAPGGEGT